MVDFSARENKNLQFTFHFKRGIQFSFTTTQIKFAINTKTLPKNEASKVINSQNASILGLSIHNKKNRNSKHGVR